MQSPSADLAPSLRLDARSGDEKEEAFATPILYRGAKTEEAAHRNVDYNTSMYVCMSKL